MSSFFSPKQSGAQLAVGRAIVTASALLFLLCGLVNALPNSNQLTDFLQENALAAFETVTEATKERKPILEEFYDRAADESDDARAQSTSPKDAQPEIPMESGSL